MSSDTSKKETNSFYKLPAALILSEKYKNISAEAKLLYTLMYSRKSISEMNNWTDSRGRVFIYYTVKEITGAIGCGHTKAAKLLDELDSNGGAGLIERKKQGLGKPNMIFINEVYDENEVNKVDKAVDKCVDNRVDNHVDKNVDKNTEASGDSDFFDNVDETEEKPVDKSVDSAKASDSECPDANVCSTAMRNSVCPQNGTQDNRKTETNYKDNNYINNNYINPVISYHVIHDKNKIKKHDTTDPTEKIRNVKNTVCSNIDYTVAAHTFGREWVDELVELIVDVVCSEEKYIRISRTDYPADIVRERFMKLNYSHIENVYFTTSTVKRRIGNIRSYMLTTLYRSVETAQSWMKARVRADMAMEK